MFDRKIFFDSIRPSLFSGSLSQQQVDGMNAILDEWEAHYAGQDLRWLAYPLATTLHETASTMWPIEEYGKGQGMPYGVKDPETGQTYYGRGFVQLTWRDNYARATSKLGLTGADDLEWHAAKALELTIASDVMFMGMMQGWFRTGKDGKPETLAKYFSAGKDDAYNAREIINGDKSKVPNWSGGVSIGNLIKGYHGNFLPALQAAWIEEQPQPEPEPEPQVQLVTIGIRAPAGVEVKVYVNDEMIG